MVVTFLIFLVNSEVVAQKFLGGWKSEFVNEGTYCKPHMWIAVGRSYFLVRVFSDYLRKRHLNFQNSIPIPKSIHFNITYMFR